jgi:hypothetical protein
VRVAAAGFRDVTVEGLRVDANRTTRQVVRLEAAGAAETLVVSDTSRSQVLTKQFLTSVPNGRSYQSAVTLAKGVTGGAGGNPNMSGGAYELVLRDHPRGDLVRVAVRAEPPGDEAAAIEFTAAHDADAEIVAWERASPALRWATAAATFAEVLRDAPVEAETGWSEVLRLVDEAIDGDRDDHREMRALVVRAATLSGGHDPALTSARP